MSLHPNECSSFALRLVTAAMAVFAVSTITACDLYFTEEPTDVREPFFEDGGVPWPDGEVDDAWQCETNTDCAAGCYCGADSWCEEAGFCESDADCTDGFACDDRSSCVPESEPEPEPECSDLNTEETLCIEAAACAPVYRGVNCTSETGVECTAGAQDCSCETFVLDRCEELEPASTDDGGTE